MTFADDHQFTVTGRILMPRAAAECTRWAAELTGFGTRMVYFPCLTTAVLPVSAQQRAQLTAAAADHDSGLVFTSGRAVEALLHTDPALLRRLRQRPAFAVGGATAEVLRQAGFSAVFSADGDVSALADFLVRAAPQHGVKWLLHCAGVSRAGDLAAALASHHLRVETCVVYEAVLNPLPQQLCADLAAGGITDIVLLSARVADHLGAVMATYAGTVPVRLFCLSSRIAEAAQRACAPCKPEIIIAPRPDAALLLRMIDDHAPGLHNKGHAHDPIAQ